jgi:hypothetical protein
MSDSAARPDSWTLLDGERAHRVAARVVEGRVRVASATLRDALGWEWKPEGLCRGAVCVPVRDRARLADADGIDLAVLAETLDRPLALDPEERAAALGHSAAERGARLASLEAPDFALPDLSGRVHRLSAHRGKKALLIAYASW